MRYTLCLSLIEHFHTIGGLLLQLIIEIMTALVRHLMWTCSCMHFILYVFAVRCCCYWWTTSCSCMKRRTEWIDCLMNLNGKVDKLSNKVALQPYASSLITCIFFNVVILSFILPKVILTFLSFSLANQKLPDVNRKPKTVSQMVSASSNLLV